MPGHIGTCTCPGEGCQIVGCRLEPPDAAIRWRAVIHAEMGIIVSLSSSTRDDSRPAARLVVLWLRREAGREAGVSCDPASTDRGLVCPTVDAGLAAPSAPGAEPGDGEQEQSSAQRATAGRAAAGGTSG